jgi:hypothetical protein
MKEAIREEIIPVSIPKDKSSIYAVLENNAQTTQSISMIPKTISAIMHFE